MIEYKAHIDMFSLEGSWWFSKLTSQSDWGNLSIARDYLKKYWLPVDEYNVKWKEIQSKVFKELDLSLPHLVFQKKFDLTAIKGGCLFLKDDFEILQKCLLEIGEKYIILVENTFNGKLEEPAFRMKYPSNITWEEFTSGNFISSTIIEHPHKEYFVFSESGKWGKYSANDYEQPLDIIGFKPEHKSIFKKSFEQSPEEWEEIKEWLPPKYKEIIK